MQASQSQAVVVPSPVQAPAPPASQPAPLPAPGPIYQVGPTGDLAPTPDLVLQAARAQRNELREQLDDLKERRDEVAREHVNTPVTQTVDRQGLELRMQELDKRIVEMEGQLAQADAAVARAAAVPGAVVPEPEVIHMQSGPPEGVFVVATVFTLFVLFPMAFAYARRIWKRTPKAMASVAIPPELTDRVHRIEQAIEAMATEVERVGEGQRFLTRVLTDQGQAGGRAIGQGAAQPVAVAGREGMGVPRD